MGASSNWLGAPNKKCGGRALPLADNLHVERVPGGKIEAWKEDDQFGVSLLPDEGQPGYPGLTYTSRQGIRDFPTTYDVGALFAWARARWR
jgi:hypothetical protein